MHFDLLVTADDPSRVAELHLLDAGGNQLAYRRTDFKELTVGRLRGLFDLRDYLRLYAGSREADYVAEIGVCIAEQVLGAEIFGHLWAAQNERTLRIQLPGARDGGNHLAAALARVPWELARPAPQQKTLGERNLLVRVVHDAPVPASQPLALSGDEPLRVLLVFAEARGSTPLDARRERRALLELFEQRIYPQRRVVAHVLSHGVTRERLAEQIEQHGGYHIVHWSGHGHRNLLELAGPGGARDSISGEELVELFVQAGGWLPRLFFLGACHSGDFLHVADWDQFLAVARGSEPGTRAEPRDLDLTERPGYTGAGHALLRSGVPAVVAMRYAVRDDYARELALEFYRRLLADPRPKTVAAALTGARNALLDDKKHDQGRFTAGDHATPVLYGEADPGLVPPTGRSPAPSGRDPRRHTIGELTLATHPHFVGRTWELAGLGADVIGTRAGVTTKPVAVITGLGGMGKTALIAEVLALWATRFDWVLLYQAKPNPLVFDATLQDIHRQLHGEAKRYHEHVKAWPADAIYRVATPDFQGPARLERLTSNLIRALQDEPILLVLDNFETNLKAEPAPSTSPLAWPCQDPAWERCLARLADELVGAPSRVLLTSRRPLAALATLASHPVVLGPLPPGEAALYLKDHSGLRRLVFGTAEEQALAQRLLTASRFHPLLMDRLARLATSQAMRPQLMAALEALETTDGFSTLPALFGTSPDDALERRYLEDALATSLDTLIGHIDPAARCLLWMIATANDPVALGMLQSVWGGEPLERFGQLQQLPQKPPEVPAKLPEIRAALDALPPAPLALPEVSPLVSSLVAVGLATDHHTGPDDANPDYTCHELVRERIRAWMDRHPHDRGGWTENALRLAFAERLEGAFARFQHTNLALALQAGGGAIVYFIQAGAYDRLGYFASAVITGAKDPRLLTTLLPHLQTAVESAPEGEPRWSCLGHLADALDQHGQPDASLPLYAAAADQARAVAQAGSGDARRAWSDLAWITSNWAAALQSLGRLDAARQRQGDAAEAHKNAGHPVIEVLGTELETLRLDIADGHAKSALPKIESRLAQVEGWWQQHGAGLPVPEAPDAEVLARTLISALDIAADVHFAQKDWEPALCRIDAILALKRTLGRPPEDIARTQINRANVLGRLGFHDTARTELEGCLEARENGPACRAAARSSLAALFHEQGDAHQAIVQERRSLALRDTLPDPEARAISHDNLANYLDNLGTPLARAEAPHHRLAALLYRLAAGLVQHLATSLHNYVVVFRRASADTTSTVLHISELLADPAFHPLAEWLRLRQVDLPALEAAVQQFLDGTRSLAEQ